MKHRTATRPTMEIQRSVHFDHSATYVVHQSSQLWSTLNKSRVNSAATSTIIEVAVVSRSRAHSLRLPVAVILDCELGVHASRVTPDQLTPSWQASRELKSSASVAGFDRYVIPPENSEDMSEIERDGLLCVMYQGLEVHFYKGRHRAINRCVQIIVPSTGHPPPYSRPSPFPGTRGPPPRGPTDGLQSFHPHLR